jgi:hypothetical protein
LCLAQGGEEDRVGEDDGEDFMDGLAVDVGSIGEGDDAWFLSRVELGEGLHVGVRASVVEIEGIVDFDDLPAQTEADFDGAMGGIGRLLADGGLPFGGDLIAVDSGMNIFLGQKAWDPYPFILLNLFLSMLAAVQAPVIMMSQNRQDTKDRLRGELDFDVNRRAELEIQGLSRKWNLLSEKLDDVEDLIREQRNPNGNAGSARTIN